MVVPILNHSKISFYSIRIKVCNRIFCNRKYTDFMSNLRTSFKNVGRFVKKRYRPQLEQKCEMNIPHTALHVNIPFHGVFFN